VLRYISLHSSPLLGLGLGFIIIFVTLAVPSKKCMCKVFVIILSIRIHPLESKEGWGLNALMISPLQLQSQSMVCMCERPSRPDVCGEGSPHPMVRLRRNIAC
jgi:hypothetical protein